MKDYKHPIRIIIEKMILAIFGLLILETFFIQPFRIPSGSMMPSLQIGDLILVNRFHYWIHPPKREDVVVFQSRENPRNIFVKRIIGEGGETIQIKDYRIYINGIPLIESYIKGPTYDTGALRYPKIIPYNQYVVLGDNRNDSYDSRYFGPVQYDSIKGKAFLIFWYERNRRGQLIWWPWWHWNRTIVL